MSNFTEKGKIEGLQDYFDSRIENVTHSLVIISSEHAAIHKGYAFIANAIIPSLIFGAKAVFSFIGPETFYPHIKGLSMSLEGATCKASIIEDATILTQGVYQDIIHKLNLNTAYAGDSNIYLGTTYSGGEAHDTILVHGSTAAGAKSFSGGSFVPTDYFEYVLKNGNTAYIYEIENIDINEETAYNIQTRLFFYEEPVGAET